MVELKAVLFDMDGLLYDTEALAIRATAWAAQRQGYLMGEAMAIQLLGTNKEKSTELILKEFPKLDPKRFWADFDIDMWKQVREDGLPIKLYAAEILGWVKEKNMKIGLCSGSPRNTVEGYLKISGMEKYFEVIVAGDDDASLLSKPAPDMYLRTASMLGIAPRHCLVLEDSPNGLRAGRAAGMMTVMIPDLVPYTEELEGVCDAVFPDLSHVPGYIEGYLCH